MTQRNFMPQVKTFLKGSSISAQNFWSTFQQKSYQQNASYYTLQLFENLISPANKQFALQYQQQMYSTLLALSYYKDRKPKNQQTINQCKKYIEKNKLGDAKWVLELFIKSHKDQNFAQDFMNRIARMPRQIDWNSNVIIQLQKQSKQIEFYLKQKQSKIKKVQDQYRRIRKMQPQTSLTLQSKILSPSYICFLDFIRGSMNQIKPIQYKHLICVFKGLLHAGKSSLLGLQQLCAFIHFTINCITFYSCSDQNLIKQLMQCANHLRNCWGVVGQMSSQLFSILYYQLKIPGHAFRKKLRRDFPALDIKQSSFLNKQYYIVTKNQDSFSCPQDRSLLNLRKLIIWHIMKVCGIQQQQMIQNINMLRTMSNDLTYQTYFKCMKIIDITIQFQVFDEIKKIIKQKIHELIQTTQKRYKIQQKASKKAQPMQTQQFDSLIQDSNYYNIFKYPLYQVIHIPLQDFTNSKSKINFYNILKKTRINQSNLLFYKGTISIIFYGISIDFINIIQILSRFIQQADIQQVRQLQIFYIPKPQLKCKNNISIYIANKDIWYKWFIYNIFKQKCILPYIQLSKQTKKLFPSYIINKSIHMYIHQAKRIFNLKIYKCSLKIKDISKIQIIYFTSYITLGLFTQAQIIRLNKLKNQQKIIKYQNITTLQIIKQKIQKINIFNVDIELQYIQNITNIIYHKKQKDFKLVDLQICGLPKQNYFGQIPDPQNNNSLKLSILTQTCSKILIKQIINKQNFRENKSSQEIFLAFKDLFINYTIKKLSVKNNNPDNLFKVFIDGVLFQKVVALDIEIPNTVNGLPITLPIMTFLPFK